MSSAAGTNRMDKSQLRRLLSVDSSDIVELLTNRQHVRPHASVKETMQDATQQLGCCATAVERATEWLQMDTTRAIGRLRRGELLQLSRAVYRFWRHSARESAIVDAK